jgi:predicted dehydrogenase
MIRWAILGTGPVSASFAAGLSAVPGATATVVASRTHAAARAFADTHGIAAAQQGHDPEALRQHADIAYIATPTALHAPHAIACLNAGLPVLVEKPLAATGAQAQAIAEAARAGGCFAMEAMWTRFLPAVVAAHAAIEGGAIGTPVHLSGSFGIANAVDPDRPLFRAEMAGGALRQYGVYPLALAQLFAGPVDHLSAAVRQGPQGVDFGATMHSRHASGMVGSFACALDATLENSFAIHGTHGTILLAGPIYRPTGYRLQPVTPRSTAATAGRNRLSRLPGAERLKQAIQARRGPAGRLVAHPPIGNGYAHQALESMRCLSAGLRESPLLPLAQSVATARLVDTALARSQAAGAQA